MSSGLQKHFYFTRSAPQPKAPGAESASTPREIPANSDCCVFFCLAFFRYVFKNMTC